MYYYLSIGTNIDPHNNAARIIRQLLDNFGPMISHPFLLNAPQNIASKNKFLNSVAIIYSDKSEKEIKGTLNQIEIALGRDRNDPLKSVKDRTADIDILGCSEELNSEFFKQFSEPYINFNAQSERDHNDYADLSQKGLPSTQGPTTIHFDRTAGQIRILDDRQHSLKNWHKTTFNPQ